MVKPGTRLLIPPISPAGPAPLYQQIVEGVKRAISGGRLRPGEALPSFRALAEDLLVSLITVKRAYEELEHQGVIFRKQGLGTFVSPDGDTRNTEAKRRRAEELMREAAREASEAGLSSQDIVRLMGQMVQEGRETVQR